MMYQFPLGKPNRNSWTQQYQRRHWTQRWKSKKLRRRGRQTFLRWKERPTPTITPESLLWSRAKSRVGWVDCHASKIICYDCYTVVQIALQYNLKLFQLDNFVKNFDAISVEDRTRVSCTSHNDARDFVIMKANNTKPTEDEVKNSEAKATSSPEKLIRGFVEKLVHEWKSTFRSFSSKPHPTHTSCVTQLNGVGVLQQPCSRVNSPKEPSKVHIIVKSNYKLYENIGESSRIIQRFSAILDTGSSSSFIASENCLWMCAKR